MRLRFRVVALSAVVHFMAMSNIALGYGPAGHRIAGLAAEPLLCRAAAAEIARLTNGESFEDLGSWADRIRGVPRFEHSAPWHYINVADDARLEAVERSPDGDVLWAIDEFSAHLADRGLDDAARAEALRFLVHFVVDVHQPLHVGRAEDRGGNLVEITFGDQRVNLHRFWDNEAIALAELSEHDYAALLGAATRRFAEVDAGSSPLEWAEESFRLRKDVYDYDTHRASGAYLRNARALGQYAQCRTLRSGTVLLRAEPRLSMCYGCIV
jgi:hypothetical protein